MNNGYDYDVNAVYDEVYFELYDRDCRNIESNGLTVNENEINGIIEMLSLTPDKTILDMPCGYGRHCKVFAEKGYKITGVELSDKMLGIANEKYKPSENVQYIKGDMKAIDLGVEFDICLNLYISFGFYKDNNDNLLVLQNIAKHLKHNGKLLMELVNPFNAVSPERISGNRYEETTNYLALIEKTIDPMTMWENYSLREINKKTCEEKYVNVGYYLYTIPEISRMAEKARLTPKKFYGGGYHDFSGKPYQFDSGRIIAIFERD